MHHSIIAICGSGAIGEYPLSADVWSGSSRYFFSEIQRRNALHSCIGGEIPKLQKILYVLLNTTCPPNKSLMIRKMYMSAQYRNALSRLLSHRIHQPASLNERSFVSIQLGAMYNLNDTKGIIRTSYNDGNFMMSLQSPYFPHGKISQRLINQTIDYERHVAGGLHYIFTTSEYLRQSFINDYGQPADKVVCIGAGLNFPQETIDAILQDVQPKDYSIPEVLFVGADFKRKGGEVLLKAFRSVKAAIPKAVLHIVGPKQPPPDTAGVVWHGYLNKNRPDEWAKLQSLYLRCSLSVLPSLYEPFGLSPLEGMLFGIPSIVSNRWALQENVPAGQVGETVTPGDADELADKMISLLQSPDKLKEYGDRCRPWVADNYRWELVVDRLETFLENF